MKRLIYSLLGLFALIHGSYSKEAPTKDTLHHHVDTILLITEQHAVSTAYLVHLIDSLLDLEKVSPKSIELVNYYHRFLSSSIPHELGPYCHPKTGTVTSKFGWRHGKMHNGVDIDLCRGDSVVVAFNGIIRLAERKGNYGNVVIVSHYNGLETVYAHLSKITVKPGQIISSGMLIGLGGSTGKSSGSHLHFEVRFKGQPINPASFISFHEHKLYNTSIFIKKSYNGVYTYASDKNCLISFNTANDAE